MTRLATLTVLTAIVFSFSSVTPLLALIETQTFDTEAQAIAGGWTGNLNQDAANGTNYGFSNTNNNDTGGVAGEAGGAVPFGTLDLTYYADTTIGTLAMDTDVLSASGLLTIKDDDNFTDGTTFIGWFDSTAAKGPGPTGLTQSIGVRILDAAHDPVDFSHFRWQAQGENEVGSPLNTDSAGLVVGTDYSFTIEYDPNGATALGKEGRVRVEFFLASDNSLVGTSIVDIDTEVPFNLNAFGILTRDLDTTGLARGDADLFIDGLSYTSQVPEPSTLGLCLAGLACYAWRRKRTAA